MEDNLRTSWVGSQLSNFPLTWSLSWDGHVYHICDQSHLTCQITLSRATTFSTAEALEINLLKILFDILVNVHSIFLRRWKLVLRIFFAVNRFPPLWIYNIAVFSPSLLYKGLIGYELLLWYDIHVTHTKFLDKLRNLLVPLNIPRT